VTPPTGSAGGLGGGSAEPAPTLANLLEELSWRGMLHGTTPGLPARLASRRAIAGYNGFDPSAPSLHVGNLVPIMGLLQFERHGGRPVALVGGGTGMIGDPSGRSDERRLLDREALEANVASIRRQLEQFLDFTPSAGDQRALLVNNLDWLGQIGLIDWLRDVGKHFTIPYMLAKDSVTTRLDRGLSFTEFSYMLIQATDYEHLHRTIGVDLQMGGADQWGNITAGLELIRRRAGVGEDEADRGVDEPAHALAYNLLLSPSGAKFGKTEGGTSVWLDAERTSPYAFYQYWLNVDDRDAATYLRWFTLLGREEIASLEDALRDRPEARDAQRALARDVTTRTHGPEAARQAEDDAAAMFGEGDPSDPGQLARLFGSVESFELTAEQRDAGAGAVAVASGAYSSNSEARRAIQQGSLWINGERVGSFEQPVPALIGGAYLVIRSGKRKKRIGRLRA
jgi:tyrosyl-tRNA synthetase